MQHCFELQHRSKILLRSQVTVAVAQAGSCSYDCTLAWEFPSDMGSALQLIYFNGNFSYLQIHFYHPILCSLSPFSFLFFPDFFLGLHHWPMEVTRLGVELELQLPVYTTATVTPDPKHICGPCHSLRQHCILTHQERPGIEPISSQTVCQLSHNENSKNPYFINPFHRVDSWSHHSTEITQ